jgi:D-amino-acid dehydrogenase
MPKIAVIGAGISGVTTAYALLEAGYEVLVLDRHRYPAMETSFANGGQLSASNAEVWNNPATIIKAMRWMLCRDAPLLLNPSPDWHKVSWLAEFLWSSRRYRENTSDTVRLAIASRQRLLAIADREKLSFDLERRGILHIYHDKPSFQSGLKVNELLVLGGLERYPVTPAEISEIEPALRAKYYGGFYTPSDATGDIHKFTRQLAAICLGRGCQFVQEAHLESVGFTGKKIDILWKSVASEAGTLSNGSSIEVDGIVVCAGVESRRIASMLGDRVNVYPVKGYSITVYLDDPQSVNSAPQVSLLDEAAKIVTSRLGADRFRVAGTAEINGYNRDIRADRIRPLEEWVRANFPGINTSRICPWAGLRPMMPNMMPVVRAGRRRGVFYNTGHGHLGWTLSAATADLVTELVQASFKNISV